MFHLCHGTYQDLFWMVDVQVYIHTGHDIWGIIIFLLQGRVMLTRLIWLTKRLQAAFLYITPIFSSLSSIIYSFPSSCLLPLCFLKLLQTALTIASISSLLLFPLSNLWFFFFLLCLSWTLFLCYSFPFFSPLLNSVFLMELPWLNRLRLLTWLSKKERLGSAERIADAAILAGDVLIERFIGSTGGGHIKEQRLIRTPLRLSLFFIPF